MTINQHHHHHHHDNTTHHYQNTMSKKFEPSILTRDTTAHYNNQPAPLPPRQQYTALPKYPAQKIEPSISRDTTAH
jgi:hypothetical protein